VLTKLTSVDETPFALSVTVGNFGDSGQKTKTRVGVGARFVVSTPVKNGRMTDQTPLERHDFSAHRKKTLHDYYHGIRGARLRHAALAVLIAVGSCSMDEMWTCLKGRHRLDPSVTKKSLADALRYECVKGRAIRIGYGVYRIGDVSPRTRRRIECEEREIRPELGRHELEEYLLREEERRLLEHIRAQRSALLLAAHKGEAAPLPEVRHHVTT
jgi:hypothetical protein